jgi:hypothetical protein
MSQVDEAFGASLSLRGSDEGGRAVDAEKAHLGLEGIGHVLRAVVVADGQAGGNTLPFLAGVDSRITPATKRFGGLGLRRVSWRSGI